MVVEVVEQLEVQVQSGARAGQMIGLISAKSAKSVVGGKRHKVERLELDSSLGRCGQNSLLTSSSVWRAAGNKANG